MQAVSREYDVMNKSTSLIIIFFYTTKAYEIILLQHHKNSADMSYLHSGSRLFFLFNYQEAGKDLTSQEKKDLKLSQPSTSDPAKTVQEKFLDHDQKPKRNYLLAMHRIQKFLFPLLDTGTKIIDNFYFFKIIFSFLF